MGSLTNQTLINSATSANDGEVSSWVVSDSDLDPQGYIFIYQLENQGPDTIVGINFNNFGSAQYVSSLMASNVTGLAGSMRPTVSLYPNFTFETVTAGGAATFGTFSPDVSLAMGATSWFVVIDTDVTSFTSGFALTQDDFQAHGGILAPNFAVYTTPEPSSAALMLLAGCICFYAILRGRRAIDS